MANQIVWLRHTVAIFFPFVSQGVGGEVGLVSADVKIANISREHLLSEPWRPRYGGERRGIIKHARKNTWANAMESRGSWLIRTRE
jgi:hypothetical protein